MLFRSEVLLRYWRKLLAWRSRRMWVVGLELIVSMFWAYVMGAVFALWLVGLVVPLPPPFGVPTLLPGWAGVILGGTCLLQFAVSIGIDSRYEPALGRYYYWMIWYPMVYWVIQTAATIVSVPKALLKRRGQRAVWISPDRGVRPRASA